MISCLQSHTGLLFRLRLTNMEENKLTTQVDGFLNWMCRNPGEEEVQNAYSLYFQNDYPQLHAVLRCLFQEKLVEFRGKDNRRLSVTRLGKKVNKSGGYTVWVNKRMQPPPPGKKRNFLLRLLDALKRLF